MDFFDYSGTESEKYRSMELYTFVNNILKTHRPCGKLEIKSAIKLRELEKLSAKSTYDFSIMKAIECMMDNYTFANALRKDVINHLKKDTSKTPFFALRKYISGGTYGQTFIIGIRDTDIQFICKVPHNSENIQQSIVEYFTGAVVINQLRRLCPTFCYTFGIFQCNSTFPKPDYELCDGDDKQRVYPYTTLEYIKGNTLCDAMRSFSLDEFIAVFTQLLIGLEIAQRECRLCHYDLSPSNIMISDTVYKFSIALDNTNYNFNSKRAVIIDFGLTSVVYQGKIISPEFKRDHNFHGKEPYLIQGFDILYLLTFMVIYCKMRDDVRGFIIETILKGIFGMNNPVNDPYGIMTKDTKKMRDEFTTSYCAKYDSMEYVNITPGMILEKLKRAGFVKGLVTLSDRTSVRKEFVSVDSQLSELYGKHDLPSFECLPEISSYMLMVETLKNLPDGSDLKQRLQSIKDERDQELRTNDSELLGKLRVMIMNEGVKEWAEQILKIRLTTPLINYNNLLDFLRQSAFVSFIEYYLTIYNLIFQLGLSNEEPYRRFVGEFTALPHYAFYINYGMTILAARRWVFTLFDKRKCYIKEEMLKHFKTSLGTKTSGYLKRENQLETFLRPGTNDAHDIRYFITRTDYPTSENILLSIINPKISLTFTRSGIWEICVSKVMDQNEWKDRAIIATGIDERFKSSRSIPEIITSLAQYLKHFGLSIKYTPWIDNAMYEVVI